MLYQSSFPGKIHDFGCLFFSLLSISEEMCGKQLTRQNILDIYKHTQSRGYLSEDCYVYNHEAIINEGNSFLIEPYIRAKYVGAAYMPGEGKDSWGKSEGEYVILQCKTEFVPGHFIRLGYNPFSPPSKILSIRSARYYSIK